MQIRILAQALVCLSLGWFSSVFGQFVPVPSAPSPKDFYALENGNLIFWGGQPWITDGTDAGTHQVKQILGTSGEFIFVARQVQSGNRNFFVANDGIAGWQLWCSDGTDAGTVMLTSEISTDFSSAFHTAETLTVFGNIVVFAGRVGIYATDGTVAGTLRISQFGDMESPGAILNGKLVILGAGKEYITDGTLAGTQTLTTVLDAVGTDQEMVNVNDVIYLVGKDSVHGTELWKLDSDNNFSLLKDIYPGTLSSRPDSLTRVDDKLFFVAAAPSVGRELWVTDGTAAGTVMVKDIQAGLNDGGVSSLVALNHRLYFVANDGVHGGELWTSDGTSAGTHLALGDFNTNGDALNPSGETVMQVVNGKLALSLQSTDDPYATAYISDGTTLGTHKIDADNPSVAEPLGVPTFAAANGLLYASTFGQLAEADAFAEIGNTWCANPEAAIPDNLSTGIVSRIHLPAHGRVSTMSVSVDIGHDYVGDLSISLRHTQTGKIVSLLYQPGGERGDGCSGRLLMVNFDDKASLSAQDECQDSNPAYPIGASVRPEEPLAALSGQSLAGDWELNVVDNARADVGVLHQWCMNFNNDSIFADEFESQ